MNTFLKYFWKDESIFVSEKDLDDLKIEMQNIFDAQDGWPFKPELAGYFRGNNFFITNKRFDLFTGKSIRYKSDEFFLEGNITSNKLSGSLITFQIKPTLQLKLALVISPLILLSIKFGHFKKKNNPLVFILVFSLILLIAFLINWYKKETIREKTIKALKLVPFKER